MLKMKYRLLLPILVAVLPFGSGFASESGSYIGQAVTCSLIGMGWVIAGFFVVLATVILIFRFMGKRKAMKPEKEVIPSENLMDVQPEQGLSGEVYAAIAMALHLYSNEQHDLENPVITMIRTSKTYSPWSSKIYSLRKLPR